MIAKLMTLVMVASILSSPMIYAADEGATTQVDASSGPATPAQPSVNTGNEVASNPEVGAAAPTTPAKGKREIARRRHKRKHHRKHRRGHR